MGCPIRMAQDSFYWTITPFRTFAFWAGTLSPPFFEMFIKVLFILLTLFCDPILAADEPDETLKVKTPVEFQFDFIQALKPKIEENYWNIQIIVVIYLVLEFYLFPYLDQCDELAREQGRKESHFKRRDELKRWREEEREREREERQLERDAEDLTTVDKWDYFSDDN